MVENVKDHNEHVSNSLIKIINKAPLKDFEKQLQAIFGLKF